jgi:hypothetical protein
VTLHSHFTPLVDVSLPFLGRQVYMHEFDMEKCDVPEGYEEPVRSLLDACGRRSGTAFLTIDEKVVRAGETQRKPGPHVDGFFQKQAMRWGHGGGWNHSCNILPAPRMEVIVASSFAACRAWDGEFEGEPTLCGDLSHLDLPDGELLKPNVGYLLSPDCIHESLPMERDTERTFMRIALPPLEKTGCTTS